MLSSAPRKHITSGNSNPDTPIEERTQQSIEEKSKHKYARTELHTSERKTVKSIQKPVKESNFEAKMLDLPPQALQGPNIEFKYDLYNQQFSVMKGGGKVGDFDAKEVVKYFLDQSLQRESNVDAIAQFLINNLIGEVDPRTPYSFRLKSHDESPFMRDVESLIKLNNALHHFEKKELPQILTRVGDKTHQEKVTRTVRHFIYQLLHHTLKVLNQLADQLKTDPGQKALKKAMAHYTVGVVYRISQFVKGELGHYGDQVKKLNSNYALVLKSRQTLGEKIDQLAGKLDQYQQKQDLILQMGGSKTPEPKPEPVPVSSDQHEAITRIMDLETPSSSPMPYLDTTDSEPCQFTAASDSE